MQLLSLLADALSDIIAWVVTVTGGLLAAGGKLVYGNRSRSRENAEELGTIDDGPTRLDEHEERMREIEHQTARMERYFMGDPEDPTDEGLLQEVHDIHQTVHEEHKNE
jgi:hypothetical protein